MEKNKYYNEDVMIFSEQRTFLGRNGWFIAKGVKVLSDAMTTRLEPITSKGKVASCCIEIPTKDLDTFIEGLKEIKYNG